MFDKEGFAIRLKSKREELRLRQEEISTKLGISRTAYAAYESGKNLPPLEAILILLEILNVSFNWLTKGEEDQLLPASSRSDESNDTREIELKYMKALETLVAQKDEIISLKDQLLEKEKAEKQKAQEESQKL